MTLPPSKRQVWRRREELRAVGLPRQGLLELVERERPAEDAEVVPMLASILFVTLTNFFVTWAPFFRSQTSTSPFSAVSRPIFATKCALESP